MNGAAKIGLLIVFCIVFSAVPSLRAYWIQDGVPLCTATGDQKNPTIVSDGAGGVIVLWQDLRNGSYQNLYAQRVNASGSVLWSAGGVAVAPAAMNQSNPMSVSDGAGGAIVTWYAYVTINPDIYVQKIAGHGVAQWSPGGLAVCTAAGTQAYPMIASDGAGGAIVAWQDSRSGTYNDIYVQRVTSAGSAYWTLEGLAICTAASYQEHPTIVSDGAGGAIVAWEDYRNGTCDIYAQRVSPSGAVHWAANGVPICVASGQQNLPVLISDGSGGAIIAWMDYRSGTSYDIYAQRVNALGAVQWTANGVPVSATTGSQSLPAIVPAEGGGAIVAWRDYRNGTDYDLYAQMVDAAGAAQWTPDGVPLCTAPLNQDAPKIASDGAGGAVVTWQDGRNGNSDIFAQRVSASGVAQWPADGVPLCEAAGNQQVPAIACDGSGDGVVAWQDYRAGATCDIYAQSVDARGRVAFLGPDILSIDDVPGDQGGWVRIAIGKSKLDAAGELEYPISAYGIWRRIDEPVSADAGDLPGGNWELLGKFSACQENRYIYRARTRADSSTSGVPYSAYAVIANTTAPSVWFMSAPDSGYSTDDLAPSIPRALAGQPCGEKTGLSLAWESNAETDLEGYAVYRGTTEDFVPDASSRIATTAEATFFDGDWRPGTLYCYKVSAVDVHGNESAWALLASRDLPGEETPRFPEASYLAQNHPNPFNPTTRVAFGLAAPARVSLNIYDAAGRLVRSLVHGELPEGMYEETWDGRDSSGRSVASGIYFYRLVAGPFESTRKMILLR